MKLQSILKITVHILLSFAFTDCAVAANSDRSDIHVKLINQNTLRICEIKEHDEAVCQTLTLPARIGKVEGVIPTVQVPSAKASFLLATKKNTLLCAVPDDFSTIHCGIVSNEKQRVAVAAPAAPAETELSQALEKRLRKPEATDLKVSKFAKVAKNLEMNITSGICYPYYGGSTDLPDGEAWCDEPCVGSNYCPIIEVIGQAPSDPYNPSFPPTPAPLPTLPTPVWPSDPNWCNVAGLFCDSPPSPPPSPEQCRKYYDDAVSECNRIYEYNPGGLPGTGTDMAGRWRRCVREYTEARGCYNF